MLTDPIADLLTRIRNGGAARHVLVSLPDSRIKREIARILQQSGYIRKFESDGDAKKPTLRIELRYDDYSVPTIEGIERVSRPGRRVYVGAKDVPKVRNGLGVAILSTPRGVMTDDQARAAHVGGEILARVW